MNTMKKFNKPQVPVAHDIHPLIQQRWSPRAFDDRPISTDHLNSLFEAIRWSASSMNAQPWEFIYARKGDPAHERIVESLMDGNKPWAQHAPILLITMIRKHFDNGTENGSAKHDLGLAIGNLSLQATDMGIGLHQMGGFYPAKAREIFDLPEDVEAVTAIALGYFGDPDSLEEPFKSKEIAQRTRKPIESFAFEGAYRP